MTDHERPLNARGERAADMMGQVLTARGLAPDIIWCSDAVRTRLTALRLIRAIPGAQQVEYISEFYHASAQNVLDVCTQKGEPDKTLMLLGHNPGWGSLHAHFTGSPHAYPTGACTVLTRKNHGDWLSPDSWTFKDLILPRELEA